MISGTSFLQFSRLNLYTENSRSPLPLFLPLFSPTPKCPTQNNNLGNLLMLLITDQQQNTAEKWWQECKLIQLLWKTAQQYLLKSKICILCDPFIGICMHKRNVYTHLSKDIFKDIIILFVISPNKKVHKSPSTVKKKINHGMFKQQNIIENKLIVASGEG